MKYFPQHVNWFAYFCGGGGGGFAGKREEEKNDGDALGITTMTMTLNILRLDSWAVVCLKCYRHVLLPVYYTLPPLCLLLPLQLPSYIIVPRRVIFCHFTRPVLDVRGLDCGKNCRLRND